MPNQKYIFMPMEIISTLHFTLHSTSIINSIYFIFPYYHHDIYHCIIVYIYIYNVSNNNSAKRWFWKNKLLKKSYMEMSYMCIHSQRDMLFLINHSWDLYVPMNICVCIRYLATSSIYIKIFSFLVFAINGIILVCLFLFFEFKKKWESFIAISSIYHGLNEKRQNFKTIFTRR